MSKRQKTASLRKESIEFEHGHSHEAISMSERNTELAKCICQNYFLANRAVRRGLTKRTIKVGMLYGGADLARAYIHDLAQEIRMQSVGRIDVTFKIMFVVEKWAPAIAMQKKMYAGETDGIAIFRWGQDMSNSRARLSQPGRAVFQSVMGVDLLLSGFFCGGFSGLANSRYLGADVLDGTGQGQSGEAWF